MQRLLSAEDAAEAQRTAACDEGECRARGRSHCSLVRRQQMARATYLDKPSLPVFRPLLYRRQEQDTKKQRKQRDSERTGCPVNRREDVGRSERGFPKKKRK
ncbi:hypothetical protein MTO96_018706 [Rhipicephalus appendiculatus]